MEETVHIPLEESFAEEWDRDLDIREVPLGSSSFLMAAVAVALLIAGVIFRLLYIGLSDSSRYRTRALANMVWLDVTPAPRGQIYDRQGVLLAEDTPSFSAFLDVTSFLKDERHEAQTLAALEKILDIGRDKVFELIREAGIPEGGALIPIARGLTQNQLVELAGLNLPAIVVESAFERVYSGGSAFSSVLGYTGFPTREDLAHEESLTGRESVGKTGIEAFYDARLRGRSGVRVYLRDARGRQVGVEERTTPKIGDPLRLTVDAKFQQYFYARMREGLLSLGRERGVGIGIDPRNGEVLALMSFPSYDNNLFTLRARSEEREAILDNPAKPLFNRAIAGLYTPGSTIKPLHGVAALVEGVIDPTRTIFSPGYLDVPNPYDPERPTRYLDWRYQGNVDLSSAIAQSSNVYFYIVGGGTGNIQGLGITRLQEWWHKFLLGKKTGIDLPAEAEGFLPSPEWKEKKFRLPWLLGDTYNVSIGQGDLLVTPLQLVNYIAAIANGGTFYKPRVNLDTPLETLADLTSLASSIREVQKGMREAVSSPLGTAHLLADLPFSVGAKTGSAEILGGAQENAFFVGYAPFDNPRIAVLVLIEDSREGSLNAVPIAKDVLEWYYWNRIVQ